MTDNVQSMTFEILRSIQQSIVDLRGSMDNQFVEVRQRLDLVEAALNKQRRENAGALVMMRSTAG
jgi:hypothetical protein